MDAGGELLSLEFREESQVKGLVSFRESVGLWSATRDSLGVGAAADMVGRLELSFGGDSTALGDQGIVGKELLRLLNDSFLPGLLGGTAGGCSSCSSTAKESQQLHRRLRSRQSE